jgi:ATP-dependent Clp protease ATP-binding subunit ClpA
VGEDVTPSLLPLAPEIQRTFEFALGEESTRRPTQVGAEHILLGLLHADEEALVDFGVGADRVRDEVQRAMALAADESSAGEGLTDSG